MKECASLALVLALCSTSLAIDLSENDPARSLLRQCQSSFLCRCSHCLHTTLLSFCPLFSAAVHTVFTLSSTFHRTLVRYCLLICVTVHTSQSRDLLPSYLSRHCLYLTISFPTAFLSLSMFTLHTLVSYCLLISVTIHTSHSRVLLPSYFCHCSHFTLSCSSVVFCCCWVFFFFSVPVHASLHSRALLPSHLFSNLQSGKL